VAEATAYPLCFQEFAGRTLTCTYQNSSLGAISSLLGAKGVIRAWGSVATMALDFALVLGCNPVIFVGQDLANSDGRTYCSGLHWEASRFSQVTNPEDWKRRWEEMRSGSTTVTMLDIFGRPVETTEILASYWNWLTREIQSNPQVRFVNATEGGILREGLEVMSLREALYRFCTEERSISHEIRAIFNQALETEPQPAADVIATLQSEAGQIHAILAKGKALCKPGFPDEIKSLLPQLEGLKESIYARRNMAQLLDCFNQMGNVAFLREQRKLMRDSNPSSSQVAAVESYGRYFESVLQALMRIETAVSSLGQPKSPRS
jgi:hypothetical protein